MTIECHKYTNKVTYYFITCTFIIFSILFTSCEKEEGEKENKNFTRTILVYMGGNSNLSSQTYQKLNALMQGWNSSFTGNLLVFQHATGDAPRLVEISNEGQEVSLITLRSYDEESSASPITFKSIIDEMKTLYIADSYGLVLFSHGSGWLPTGTLESPRSVVVDRKEEMEIREFANVIPNNCFDFIVFEACFMAGIEVAYELKDKTSYIVASSAEILTPGFTKIYPHSINYLYETNADLTSFTQTAFNYFNSLYGDNRSATFSIINTSKLNNLSDWMKRNWDTQNIDVNLSEIQKFDRYENYSLFFDFEDYYSKFFHSEEKKNKLSELIKDCIVYKNSTSTFMPNYNGFEIKKHSGLTTYILQEEFDYLNEEYKQLKWYKEVFEN